jgi:5-methylcytosine-specific restriction enzyme B
MPTHNLKTDEGLCAAVEAIGSYQTWGEGGSQWVLKLAETIRWVQSADENGRRTYEFQKRLWEDNHVASVGQGSVPVDKALVDEGFRDWMAKASMNSLPTTAEQQGQFLSNFYRDLKLQLKPFTERVPHLKIFRVLAAVFPDAMTTIASTGPLWRLVREMGMEAGLDSAKQHVWVRDRLRAVIGPDATDSIAKAERMAIPWLLYERYVKAPDQRTEEEIQPGAETSLLPLPAVRRRRGLTAIKGLFPAVLSTLEFVREGVTRELPHAMISWLRRVF